MENQVLLTKRKYHFFIHGSYSGPVRNSTFPFLSVYYTWVCLQCGTSGKEPPCQRGKHKKYGFDPWVEKIPWRRAGKPTPVFWPGESCGYFLWSTSPEDLPPCLNLATTPGGGSRRWAELPDPVGGGPALGAQGLWSSVASQISRLGWKCSVQYAGISHKRLLSPWNMAGATGEQSVHSSLILTSLDSHSNCGAGEDSWESLGLQGDQTSQS